MWLSISTIFSVAVGSINDDVIRFSTAKTTPWLVQIPTAVDPSYDGTSGKSISIKCQSSHTRIHVNKCMHRWKATYLNSFNSIFNLEQSTLGWESVNTSIVLWLRKEHDGQKQLKGWRWTNLQIDSWGESRSKNSWNVLCHSQRRQGKDGSRCVSAFSGRFWRGPDAFMCALVCLLAPGYCNNNFSLSRTEVKSNTHTVMSLEAWKFTPRSVDSKMMKYLHLNFCVLQCTTDHGHRGSNSSFNCAHFSFLWVKSVVNKLWQDRYKHAPLWLSTNGKRLENFRHRSSKKCQKERQAINFNCIFN